MRPSPDTFTLPRRGDRVVDHQGEFGRVTKVTDDSLDLRPVDEFYCPGKDEILVWAVWETTRFFDMSRELNIPLNEIRACVCWNCNRPYEEHTANGKCLYAPTYLLVRKEDDEE